MEEPLLAGAVHQVIDGGHMETGVEQVFAQDAAEVAKAAGDQDTVRHQTLPLDCGRAVHTSEVCTAGAQGLLPVAGEVSHFAPAARFCQCRVALDAGLDFVAFHYALPGSVERPHGSPWWIQRVPFRMRADS